MSHHALAMLYGIVGTVLFNISKGMQRHGIEAVSAIFPSRKQPTADRPARSPKIISLYITGFILNNSLGFFAILANRHAPPSYFTSMFGVGIIALMLYSGLILKEPIRPRQYAGAAVLALGTLLLGFDGIARKDSTMAGINLALFGLMVGLSFLTAVFLLLWAHRTRSVLFLGIIYGLVIGFTASLDPVLKGIGQSLGGGERYLPRLSWGWVIFLLSFLFATLSFAASQWIFRRGVHASVLIPSQNFSYIVYPLFIQAVTLPGFKLTALTLVGLLITFLSFVFMHFPVRKSGTSDVHIPSKQRG
jgi:drug/metabolite transporter (DMT)-like permease